MSRKLIRLILVLILPAMFTGCSDAEQEKIEADLTAGEALVKKNCLVCHAQGINGAPIIGNAKMWGPRIKKGQDVLVQSATNGFGLMPAKGGKVELTDEEIALAVNYMVSQITNK